MQEGVVIFSQKDVDTGLMKHMTGYAEDMGVSVSDMLRHVFIRRMANDMAQHLLTGDFSPDFVKDTKIKPWMDRHGCEQILEWTLYIILSDNHYYEEKPGGELQ